MIKKLTLTISLFFTLLNPLAAMEPALVALAAEINNIRYEHNSPPYGINLNMQYPPHMEWWLKNAPCPSDQTCGWNEPGWWTTATDDGRVLGPDTYCRLFNTNPSRPENRGGHCQVAMMIVDLPMDNESLADWAKYVAHAFLVEGPCYKARLYAGSCRKSPTFIIDNDNYGEMAIWAYHKTADRITIFIWVLPHTPTPLIVAGNPPVSYDDSNDGK